MKFILDDMLGKLARWLRIMGYDAKYCTRISDDELINEAKKEGRILLTRDRLLVKRFAVSSLLIKSEDIKEQIKQVIERFNLDTKNIFTRCPSCNGLLEKIKKEKAYNNVPNIVFSRYDNFSLCTLCGKYYWKGNHWEKIKEGLTELTQLPIFR
ncbi:MAG: Mut7-C RNAse domain-containing protein [bacterium]